MNPESLLREEWSYCAMLMTAYCSQTRSKFWMILFIDLKNGIEKFEFIDKGLIEKYLGVEIEKLSGSEFILR